MKKWTPIVFGPILAIVALAAIIGWMLPAEHSATRSLGLKQTPEAVWQAITDYPAMPSWRKGLTKIERLADRDGHAVWKETAGRWEVPLEDLDVEPPRRLVRKVADPDLPYGGAWTYLVTPADGGSRITITEEGFVKNPIFRLMARLGNKREAIDNFLTALAQKFGEPPKLE